MYPVFILITNVYKNFQRYFFSCSVLPQRLLNLRQQSLFSLLKNVRLTHIRRNVVAAENFINDKSTINWQSISICICSIRRFSEIVFFNIALLVRKLLSEAAWNGCGLQYFCDSAANIWSSLKKRFSFLLATLKISSTSDFASMPFKGTLFHFPLFHLIFASTFLAPSVAKFPPHDQVANPSVCYFS